MHFQYNKLRIESGRVGLVIDAADTDASLYALPVADLFRRVFDLAGFASKVSSGGLIARQLITQLGGVSGAIVFKIPGVRRLLVTQDLADVGAAGDVVVEHVLAGSSQQYRRIRRSIIADSYDVPS